jgi:hypothetical protein
MVESWKPLVLIWNGPISKPIHRQVSLAIHEFMQTWFAIPSDSDVMFCDLMGAYSRKRRDYLIALDRSDTVFEEWSDTQKWDVIKKGHVAPYQPCVPSLDVQLFEAWPRIQPVTIRPATNKMVDPYVPPKQALTCKLKIPILEFYHTPQTIKLSLENTTSIDQDFVIQMSHPECFRVVPAYGTVEKLKSLSLVLTCRATTRHPPGKIRGSMCIRSLRGYPIERLTLSMINTPVLRCSSTHLDFGTCLPLETRSIALVLTNILSVDCPIVMILKPSKTSSTFQLPQTQTSVAPHDSKTIWVKATPDIEGPLSDVLYIVAMGGQVLRITLTVECGSSLDVLEDHLAFGFTDIFFSPVQKSLTLTNRTKQRLPIRFTTSTRDIHVQDVVLDPQQESHVPIQFHSTLSGTRHETVTVFAPNAHPHVVHVTAFSGPYLKLPVFQEMYFPAAILGETTYLRFPITNLFHEPVHTVISLPQGYPIKLGTLPFDSSNPSTGDFQAKNVPSGKSDTLRFLIPPLATAIIEIAFTGTKAGTFKIPLYTTMTKPTKMDISTNYLFLYCVSESSLSRTLQNTEELQKWAIQPYFVPLTDPSMFQEKDVVLPRRPTSTVFQLDPPMKVVFGALSSRTFESLDFVQLINVTNEPQRYRILLSYHFTTELPLEGELPAHAFLDIPVRVNPKIAVSPESLHFTALGSITVLDCHFSEPGMLTTQLMGCIDDTVCMELRNETSDIEYPETLVMESSSRSLFVRNKTMLPVTVEFKTHHTDPFLLPKQLILKPFGVVRAEMGFRPTLNGTFVTRFQLAYLDPNYTDEVTQRARGPRLRTMRSVQLVGIASQHEVQVEPDLVLFGDMDRDDMEHQELMVVNESASKERVIMANGATLISPTQWVLESKDSFSCDVTLPPQLGPVQDLICFDIGGTTHVVNVVGNIGTMKLASNLGTPMYLAQHHKLDDMEPAHDSIIHVGNVCIGDERHYAVELINQGTLDIVVSRPEFGESNVSFEPIYPHFYGTISDANRISFGKENLDQVEMDWEQFAFLQESKPFMNAYFRSKQTHTPPSRRMGSVFSGNKKLSNLFPSHAVAKDTHPKYGGVSLDHLFPFRLAPKQSVKVDVKFSADNLGAFLIPMKMRASQSVDAKQFVMWLKGTVLRPLILNAKLYDLGTCPISTHQVHFRNLDCTREIHQ